MNEYISVMHVHTIHSDGHGDVDIIARDARLAGVDIVFVTDHGNDDVRRLGKEGWYEDVLVLSGYELNDIRNKNHYLVFGVDQCLGGDGGARKYVREVRERGGIGFLAHPDERRDYYPEHPSYEWTDWDIEGFDGIEIWNYMSEWMEALRPGRRFLNLLFPDRCIRGPTEKVLRFWDERCRKRKIVAIGSADAHCYQHRLLGFTVSIFPYERLFRRIRTHFLLPDQLTGNFEVDRDMVLGTLREGRLFVSNLREGEASCFSFTARSLKGTTWMGGEVAISDKPVLRIWAPLEGHITLLRDGATCVVEKGHKVEYAADEAGSYRVEVTRHGRSWIYSNAIRVV